MAFTRGGTRKAGESVHTWINNPNTAHRKCTRCGMSCDITSKDGNAIYLYTSKDGIKSDKFLPCVK